MDLCVSVCTYKRREIYVTNSAAAGREKKEIINGRRT